MRDGSAYFQGLDKFGGASGNDPDWFLLSIRGRDGGGNLLPGEVAVYLADYRFGDNTKDFILDQWEYVDLSALSEARSLVFNMSSSRNNDLGIMTPTFFAIDRIGLVAVPEPSTIALVTSGLATLVGLWWGRRRTANRAFEPGALGYSG